MSTTYSPAVLSAMFDNAKAIGGAMGACTRLITEAKITDWSKANKDAWLPLRNEFIYGRVAGYLTERLGKAHSREDARYICEDLVRPATTVDSAVRNDRRSALQEKAKESALSMWTQCATAAGKPRKDGTARTAQPKKGKAPRTAAAMPKGAIIVKATPKGRSFTMPPAKTVADVLTFAENISALLVKYQSENAKQITVDIRPVFAGFVTGIKNAKAKASKPRTTRGK